MALEKRRLLYTTPGKDAAAFARFAEDLQAHIGHAEHITGFNVTP